MSNHLDSESSFEADARLQNGKVDRPNAHENVVSEPRISRLGAIRKIAGVFALGAFGARAGAQDGGVNQATQNALLNNPFLAKTPDAESANMAESKKMIDALKKKGFLVPERNIETQQELLYRGPTIVRPLSIQPTYKRLSRTLTCNTRTTVYFPCPNPSVLDQSLVGCLVEVRPINNKGELGDLIPTNNTMIKSDPNPNGMQNHLVKVDLKGVKGEMNISVDYLVNTATYPQLDGITTNKIKLSDIGPLFTQACNFPYNANNSTFDIRKALQLESGDCAVKATLLCDALIKLGFNAVVGEGFSRNHGPHAVCIVVTNQGLVVLDPLNTGGTIGGPEGFLVTRLGNILTFDKSEKLPLITNSTIGSNNGFAKNGKNGSALFASEPTTPPPQEGLLLARQLAEETERKYSDQSPRVAGGFNSTFTQEPPPNK